jgi:hypothetical protein
MKCHRSQDYLEFIRTRPCMISGSNLDVVAHHVRCLGGGGTGIKPSDYLCVPLTAQLHAQLHHMGERSFYERHGIDIHGALKMNLLIYMASNEKYSFRDVISLIENLGD